MDQPHPAGDVVHGHGSGWCKRSDLHHIINMSMKLSADTLPLWCKPALNDLLYGSIMQTRAARTTDKSCHASSTATWQPKSDDR